MWRADPMLASVRGPALDVLPEGEAARWRAFWTGAATPLDRLAAGG